MKYYTAKGDAGTTKLFACPEGTRLSKGEGIFEVLGEVDELNSFVGLCRALVERDVHTTLSQKDRRNLAVTLQSIQEDLFSVQSILAGSPKPFGKAKVTKMEKKIHQFSEVFQKVDSFVIPGATVLGGFLDVARTVSRRVEREYVRECDAHPRQHDSPVVRAYLNRLSSLLYVLARVANHADGGTEQAPTYR
ncbi:MAG: ATP:cob(I)alamin adenosyltransferase [Candidatus Taylorbacteria bacterium CG11_big_fil_rev_8_21_14_0_20_46_11]|uniref:Corrinoid adenosyltransferase n=1 Tax=Candidatus Taylorbacteria bacterium CG11_big_fil_rev_8_21_14_0_20_46_11 TaxID=1975025 RepID=A0A2H0KAG7_9BACT|nr:MAG: ATP:cob(I)alamin adenosyltransferase [Candidatus Taylorbacteria bacterium CG11_big_fil_rev_8_21_14_0_20_46_11]